MGSFDVGTVLAMYERDETPTVEPMHGVKGEVRRNPSTDQKKERRKMTKQAADEAAQTESIPQLLARAARASTLAEQEQLMTEVERRNTEHIASLDASRALDLTIKEAVEIVPRGLHELHTNQTDWLLSEGLHATASLSDAEHELVAQATLWFGRVPGYVKEEQDEFRIQALHKAAHLASQYGEHADSARQAFITETERLYRQSARAGEFVVKTASSLQEGMLPQPGPDQSVHGMTPDPDYRPPTEPKPSPHQDPAHPTAEKPELPDTPALRSEVDRHLTNQDTSGVREMAESFAEHQLRGGNLQVAASLQREATAAAERAVDDAQLAAVLAGVGPDMPAAADAAQSALDSTSNGVRDDADQFAQQQLADQRMAVADPQTTSERSPALQELEGYSGWNGTSVVPQGDSGAAAMNNDAEPEKDFAGTGIQGFPVSGSTHAAQVAAQLQHTASKENRMTTTHAQCPTCSGSGHVAVRQVQAYSGLPQIDQIVNADETPGTEPAPGQSETFPSQVAFPWQMSPDNVTNAIGEAEQQIATRPQGRPGAPGGGGGIGGSVTAGQHQANGRDNSGWMGDMGAKGLDYPGYSTPAYDGSNNLGAPDPVYGFGGDQGNQPHEPYGEAEANDYTNNPGMNWQPGQPTQYDQGQSTVSPTLNTQGSFHPDPVIAAAQQQILAAQAQIRDRSAQIG